MIIPYKKAKDRLKLALQAQAGDRWINLQSMKGNVATVVLVTDTSVHLERPGNRGKERTVKRLDLFASRYTPERPPQEPSHG